MSLRFGSDTNAQIMKFGIVGTIGFLVDGLILTLLVERTELGAYLPRLISFPIALSVTWFLNRVWTFSASKSERRTSEYARYFAVQSAGCALNFLIYALLIFFGPRLMGTVVLIPLAIASLAGLMVNFFGAKLWVFRAEP